MEMFYTDDDVAVQTKNGKNGNSRYCRHIDIESNIEYFTFRRIVGPISFKYI